MSASLQHALEALYGLERRRDKHDLEGITALLQALGNPHHRFRSVHVAGTNGKGSVCALIERVLREAGIRTGLFTSPHLVDFRERIRVRGRWADETWLQRKLEHIASLPEGRDRTFFEVCTALAFESFAEQGVDIAVVEVGLGGRLDCTNIITPLVSVLTSIGLDHTEILGDTIEQIAAEKAGIAKPGVPLVMGRLDQRARAEAERVAATAGAPIVTAPVLTEVRFSASGSYARAHTDPWGELEIEIPLGGEFQLENAAVAIGALATMQELPGDPAIELAPGPVSSSRAERRIGPAGSGITARAVREGLRLARWPGRLERCPSHRRLWWDGAHNAAGVLALVRAWRQAGLPAPREIVLALSRDKDAAAIVTALADLAPAAGLLATRASHDRTLPPEIIAELASAAGFAARVAATVPEACLAALARAGDGRVLLTGSLFAVGEAMAAFGGAPGEML